MATLIAESEVGPAELDGPRLWVFVAIDEAGRATISWEDGGINIEKFDPTDPTARINLARIEALKAFVESVRLALGYQADRFGFADHWHIWVERTRRHWIAFSMNDRDDGVAVGLLATDDAYNVVYGPTLVYPLTGDDASISTSDLFLVETDTGVAIACARFGGDWGVVCFLVDETDADATSKRTIAVPGSAVQFGNGGSATFDASRDRPWRFLVPTTLVPSVTSSIHTFEVDLDDAVLIEDLLTAAPDVILTVLDGVTDNANYAMPMAVALKSGYRAMVVRRRLFPRPEDEEDNEDQGDILVYLLNQHWKTVGDPIVLDDLGNRPHIAMLPLDDGSSWKLIVTWDHKVGNNIDGYVWTAEVRLQGLILEFEHGGWPVVQEDEDLPGWMDWRNTGIHRENRGPYRGEPDPLPAIADDFLGVAGRIGPAEPDRGLQLGPPRWREPLIRAMYGPVREPIPLRDYADMVRIDESRLIFLTRQQVRRWR